MHQKTERFDFRFFHNIIGKFEFNLGSNRGVNGVLSPIHSSTTSFNLNDNKKFVC